jgi:hypothetical protein
VRVFLIHKTVEHLNVSIHFIENVKCWQFVYEDDIYSLYYYYYVLLNLKICLSINETIYLYGRDTNFESLKKTSVGIYRVFHQL